MDKIAVSRKITYEELARMVMNMEGMRVDGKYEWTIKDDGEGFVIEVIKLGKANRTRGILSDN